MCAWFLVRKLMRGAATKKLANPSGMKYRTMSSRGFWWWIGLALSATEPHASRFVVLQRVSSFTNDCRAFLAAVFGRFSSESKNTVAACIPRSSKGLSWTSWAAPKESQTWRSFDCTAISLQLALAPPQTTADRGHARASPSGGCSNPRPPQGLDTRIHAHRATRGALCQRCWLEHWFRPGAPVLRTHWSWPETLPHHAHRLERRLIASNGKDTSWAGGEAGCVRVL